MCHLTKHIYNLSVLKGNKFSDTKFFTIVDVVFCD